MLDKEQLVNGRALTANHIAAGQILLKQAYPHQCGLLDTCQLSKSKCVDVTGKFVQVIFVEPNHWACLTNKFTSSNQTVNLYDSLHTIPEKLGSIVRQACSILKTKASTVTIDVINVQLQEGGSDCGLFALAMATDLCRDNDPVNMSYHQHRMRSHLEECFENLILTPFPSCKNTKSKKSRVLNSTNVEVYCVCRQPEQLPMVECDNCSVWFHTECADVSIRILESLDSDENIPWFCATCKYHYRGYTSLSEKYECSHIPLGVIWVVYFLISLILSCC